MLRQKPQRPLVWLWFRYDLWMTRIYGFSPVVGKQPKVLVLGSMPSVASLEQQQYYAKPQNAFWRIMGAMFDAGPDVDYNERTARLIEAGIALWDVLASCVRPGSLDASIDMTSAQANDLPGLLRKYPTIRAVFFNGRKAEQMFQRWAYADVQIVSPNLTYHAMPSTSPAMASLNFDAKLDRWSKLKDVLEA